MNRINQRWRDTQWLRDNAGLLSTGQLTTFYSSHPRVSNKLCLPGSLDVHLVHVYTCEQFIHFKWKENEFSQKRSKEVSADSEIFSIRKEAGGKNI